MKCPKCFKKEKVDDGEGEVVMMESSVLDYCYTCPKCDFEIKWYDKAGELHEDN